MKIMNKLVIIMMTILLTYGGSPAWAMDPELSKKLAEQPQEIKLEILEQMIKGIKDFDSLKEIPKTFGSIAQTSTEFNKFIEENKERLAKAIHSQIEVIIETTPIDEVLKLEKGEAELPDDDIVYDRLFSLAETVESPILIELLKQRILEPGQLSRTRTPDNLEFLFKKGIDPSIKNEQGETILHLLIYDNPTSHYYPGWLINHIKQSGGDVKKYVNTPDKEGQTALHIAMQNNTPELVTLLLKSGADPYKKDSGEETPLHTAFPEYEEEEGEEEIEIDPSLGKDVTQLIVEHIKESGGNVEKYVNEQDVEGHIPLHHAAMIGATEAAQLLIEAGSNVHALDKENKKPIDVAENDEMKQLLEKAMKQQPEEKSSKN